MRRVLVSVEGQTEEAFVTRTLRPHLHQVGVDVVPSVVTTKRIASGPNKKGGVNSWSQIRDDLRDLLNDSNAAAITTMYDLYGLPTDTPGVTTMQSGADVRTVEDAIAAEFGNPKLRPNIVLHELEALLYANPELCGEYLGSRRLTTVMNQALDECGNPEQVNNSVDTAPSKRILNAHPEYQKVLHGSVLIDRIGLANIRDRCEHFGIWLSWLESLGEGPAF